MKLEMRIGISYHIYLRCGDNFIHFFTEYLHL
jgi:hypothetical protein